MCINGVNSGVTNIIMNYFVLILAIVSSTSGLTIRDQIYVLHSNTVDFQDSTKVLLAETGISISISTLEARRYVGIDVADITLSDDNSTILDVVAVTRHRREIESNQHMLYLGATNANATMVVIFVEINNVRPNQTIVDETFIQASDNPVDGITTSHTMQQAILYSTARRYNITSVVYQYYFPDTSFIDTICSNSAFNHLVSRVNDNYRQLGDHFMFILDTDTFDCHDNTMGISLLSYDEPVSWVRFSTNSFENTGFVVHEFLHNFFISHSACDASNNQTDAGNDYCDLFDIMGRAGSNNAVLSPAHRYFNGFSPASSIINNVRPAPRIQGATNYLLYSTEYADLVCPECPTTIIESRSSSRIALMFRNESRLQTESHYVISYRTKFVNGTPSILHAAFEYEFDYRKHRPDIFYRFDKAVMIHYVPGSYVFAPNTHLVRVVLEGESFTDAASNLKVTFNAGGSNSTVANITVEYIQDEQQCQGKTLGSPCMIGASNGVCDPRVPECRVYPNGPDFTIDGQHSFVLIPNNTCNQKPVYRYVQDSNYALMYINLNFIYGKYAIIQYNETDDLGHVCETFRYQDTWYETLDIQSNDGTPYFSAEDGRALNLFAYDTVKSGFSVAFDSVASTVSTLPTSSAVSTATTTAITTPTTTAVTTPTTIATTPTSSTSNVLDFSFSSDRNYVLAFNDIVTWTTTDQSTHKVKLNNGLGTELSGNISSGTSSTVTMTLDPGTYPIVCKYHSIMTGSLTILADDTTTPTTTPTTTAVTTHIVNTSTATFTPELTTTTSFVVAPKNVQVTIQSTDSIGSIQIQRDGSIDWSNNDSETHQYVAIVGTSYHQLSGMLGAHSATTTVVNLVEGNYTIVCAIHSKQAGTLRVVAAVADEPSSNSTNSSLYVYIGIGVGIFILVVFAGYNVVQQRKVKTQYNMLPNQIL